MHSSRYEASLLARVRVELRIGKYSLAKNYSQTVQAPGSSSIHQFRNRSVAKVYIPNVQMQSVDADAVRFFIYSGVLDKLYSWGNCDGLPCTRRCSTELSSSPTSSWYERWKKRTLYSRTHTYTTQCAIWIFAAITPTKLWRLPRCKRSCQVPFSSLYRSQRNNVGRLYAWALFQEVQWL